ncbi:hypothetical protein [Hyphomonas pacifica]|uniref:hypothetical protein n=1 Tax=Hyphomonas pacifica TaxID=1280941 RepID=UPI0011BE69CD|nr:hypothetical protein [Hyphomonas pacifica]
MDTPVFTEIGPRAIASLEDEPLITPHSDTAEEAYWRMIDAFSSVRDVVRNYPEIGALPFEAPARIDEAQALISSTEGRIPKALLTPADRDAVETAFRAMKTELKMLVLHHMFILNWEVSAQLGPGKTWVRLPFGLIENDLCQIDASWRSGDFGGLPLTNICVHRHDLGVPDSARFITDSNVPQKLPILLNRDLLIYQHTHQSSAPTAAQSRTVAGFLSSELSYFPKRIDSQHPGKIYAQVLREPPKARGRPKIIGATESVFLSIWQPELSNASQKFVFGKMIDAWPDEVNGRIVPPPNIDTLKNHLAELGYWERGIGWNTRHINSKKFVHDSGI